MFCFTRSENLPSFVLPQPLQSWIHLKSLVPNALIFTRFLLLSYCKNWITFPLLGITTSLTLSILSKSPLLSKPFSTKILNLLNESSLEAFSHAPFLKSATSLESRSSSLLFICSLVLLSAFCVSSSFSAEEGPKRSRLLACSVGGKLFTTSVNGA